MTNHSMLHAQLAAAIGETAMIDDPAARNVMGNDVYHGGGTPALIVRPANVADLQSAVRICAAAGVAMVPRGGGASYTDAYLYPAGGHVLFDTGALDTIAIDLDNAVVTVGAGTTWANLKTTLAAQGVRTPFWGPFSGIAATVGGSMSQNTVSHGSGTHGISAHSALSMDVVLASGELIRTSASAATRHYGPDLTGLFTGDCGTLGIKAAISLPLLPDRTDAEMLSFAFDSFADCHAGVSRAQHEMLDDSHFGVDLALSQGQIGRQESFSARLKIARDIMRAAPNPVAGIRQLIKLALSGEKAMRAGQYMAHYTIEGVDAAEAAARAKRLRAIMAPYGREIANSVPSFVRMMPFAPLINILGPGGERWVPLHGVLRHSDVVPFHEAFQSFLADRKDDMQRLGVWTGMMFSPVGPSGFLYEIALYWPDARTAYHEHVLDPAYLATLPAFPANAEVHGWVDRFKRDIIDLFQQYGAAHFQIGRAYPYRARLDPQSSALLSAIKATLDPHGLMNPGALGLPA